MMNNLSPHPLSTGALAHMKGVPLGHLVYKDFILFEVDLFVFLLFQLLLRFDLRFQWQGPTRFLILDLAGIVCSFWVQQTRPSSHPKSPD